MTLEELKLRINTHICKILYEDSDLVCFTTASIYNAQYIRRLLEHLNKEIANCRNRFTYMPILYNNGHVVEVFISNTESGKEKIRTYGRMKGIL